MQRPSIIETQLHNLQHSNQTIKVKRHWFGLFFLYTLICFGLVLTWAFVLPIINSWTNLGVVFIIGALLFVVVLILFGLISRIYWSNQLMITKINVQQIAQEALFVSKSSILGLANIEDVTVIRRGFFAHIFNYGTLNIETAGEQDNFKFNYCPKPEAYAQLVMQIREVYLENPDKSVR